MIKSKTRSPDFLELYQNDAEGASVLFFLASLSTIILVAIIRMGADVLWVDFLHSNPHRSHMHALILPFVMGILEGIWLIFDMLVALLVAPLVVYLVVRLLKRFPIYILLVLIPICLLLVYAQDNIVPNMTWYTDTPETEALKYGPSGRAMVFASFLVPSLLVSWWIVRRGIKRMEERAKPEIVESSPI